MLDCHTEYPKEDCNNRKNLADHLGDQVMGGNSLGMSRQHWRSPAQHMPSQTECRLAQRR